MKYKQYLNVVFILLTTIVLVGSPQFANMLTVLGQDRVWLMGENCCCPSFLCWLSLRLRIWILGKLPKRNLLTITKMMNSRNRRKAVGGKWSTRPDDDRPERKK